MSEEIQHRYELQMYTNVNGKSVFGGKIFLGYFKDYNKFKKWAVSHGWILPKSVPNFQWSIWEDGVLIRGAVGEYVETEMEVPNR